MPDQYEQHPPQPQQVNVMAPQGQSRLMTIAVTALVGIVVGGAPGMIATRDLAHEDDLANLQSQISDLRADLARVEQKLDDAAATRASASRPPAGVS